MGRTPSPWYNTSKKGWYVELDGRQEPLVRPCKKTGATKAEAMKIFGQLLAERDQVRTTGITLAGLCDHFEDHLERELAPLTRDWYVRHLLSFKQHFGAKTAAESVKPKDVTAWLAKYNWTTNTRHGAVTAVKGLYRWGKREGHLDTNPLVDLVKPPAVRREAVMTQDQYEALLAVIPDQRFRDLLVALRETGARPGEVTGLTADRVNVQDGTWTVLNKTRRATKEETRVIYLSPAMCVMSQRMLLLNPTGNVFRNRLGNQWTRNAMACRFADLKVSLKKLEVKLGKEGVAYSLRHLYITDALEKGIPPATVAELVGHKDLTMIMRIYNRLKQRTGHLRAAAAEIRKP